MRPATSPRTRNRRAWWRSPPASLPQRDTARLRQANEQRTRAAEHAVRLLATHREAALQADAAVQKSQEAAQAAATTRQEVQDAAQKVETAITTVAKLLAAWAARLPPRLRPTPSLLEGWVCRVGAIADADPPTPVLAGMVGREHLSPTRRPLENRAAQLTHERAATEQKLAAAGEELAAIQAETDPRPDPPVLWRRRERPDGSARQERLCGGSSRPSPACPPRRSRAWRPPWRLPDCCRRG